LVSKSVLICNAPGSDLEIWSSPVSPVTAVTPDLHYQAPAIPLTDTIARRSSLVARRLTTSDAPLHRALMLEAYTLSPEAFTSSVTESEDPPAAVVGRSRGGQAGRDRVDPRWAARARHCGNRSSPSVRYMTTTISARAFTRDFAQAKRLAAQGRCSSPTGASRATS
jgi:hypothetical protein